MRIVAGEFRGRRIAAPRGLSTRPTADRVREGLFDALTARLGADLGGRGALDAFAGSGALGLEALSRGSALSAFVEKDPSAIRTLRANVESLALGNRAKILAGEIGALAGRPLVGRPFSLLFLDPPYRIGSPEVGALIGVLGDAGNLAAGAVIVWEHDLAGEVDWPESVEGLFRLSYGTTRIDAGTYVRGDAT